MKKQVFLAAWAYIRKGIYTTLSDALKAAWAAIKIKAKLSAGKVEFSFRKANGAIRKAVGTLSSDMLPKVESRKERQPKPDLIKYYDLEKMAWRAFRIERFIGIAA